MNRVRRLQRRKALAISAASAATSLAPWPLRQASANLLGANDRIRVGVIGIGVRGKYLIGNLPESASVVAICDCAESRLQSALQPTGLFESVLADFTARSAKQCMTYKDYRQMLEAPAMDAVIIATPDHHHAPAAIRALNAGLDVYLEKPMTLTIGEGRLLVEAVKKTGRVLQVGSQQRTMEVNRFACEFVRDGGLGTIDRIECRNFPGPEPAPDFPEEPIPAGLDWDLFLGPTGWRKHNRKLWVKDDFKIDGLLWRGWDLFREYSGHLVTNWGGHSLDMVQYALGMDDSGPVKIELLSGAAEADIARDWQEHWRMKTPKPVGTFLEDGRLTPVRLTYTSGVTLELKPGANTETYFGDRGRMEIGRNRFRCDPPGLVSGAPDASVAATWAGAGHVARPHLQNWLDCIRSRATPNAPVEAGHRSATVCHLINLARQLKRTLHWDPAAETFSGDDEANRLISRPYRRGFQLEP